MGDDQRGIAYVGKGEGGADQGVCLGKLTEVVGNLVELNLCLRFLGHGG